MGTIKTPIAVNIPQRYTPRRRGKGSRSEEVVGHREAVGLRGRSDESGGRSQLLETTVHVSFAALAGPSATLEAKLFQVLFEILVLHGPVGLRFTVRLQRNNEKGVQCAESSLWWDASR